jgi:hypothetical protein
VGGHPHQPIATWRRISIALRQLPELLRRVRRLEQHLIQAQTNPDHKPKQESEID